MNADQIQLVLGDPPPHQLYYLRGNGSTWRTLTSPADAADSPIVGATGMIQLRRINPDPAYRIRRPFDP